jgi:hypothetical protein
MDHAAPTGPPEIRLTGLVLMGETPEGPARVDGLTLEASASGLSVADGTGRLARCWTWGEVEGFRADGCAPGDDGAYRQVLEVHAAGKEHAFLVPATDVSGFLAALTTAPARWWPAPRHPAAGRLGAAGRTVADTLVRVRVAAAVLVVAAWASLDRRTAPWREALIPGRARHAARPGARLAPLVAGLCGVGLLAGSAVTAGPAPGHGHLAAGNGGLAQSFGGHSSAILALPAATRPPAPAPPSLADAPSLSSHEIFGFAPYWNLPTASSFDVADLSTLAYFSVDVNGDGTIDRSGPGWVGYQSQALADLVTRAHQAGDRVVLTATCFNQGSLDAITSNPAAATTLAQNLVQLVRAKNLDGVNIDFEGEGSGDQAGLDRLIATLSAAVHRADAHWQLTMDTYASAAGDSSGFYDIPQLAKSVDAFFVMAYDMNSRTQPSATAPLAGGSFSDEEAVQQFTAVVPASKVILGVPYYGYDWPTAGPNLGDPATGGPSPWSYSQIAASGHPVYWDSATQTPWTSYQVGGQWHQTFFDNPTSLALKAELANFFHLRGLGVWALGMDGNDPNMIAALLGHAPVAKDLPSGPGHPAVAPAPAYQYTATWAGKTVDLQPLAAGKTPLPISAPVGLLTHFATDDPAAVCLATGPALAAAPVIGQPGIYEIETAAPTYCDANTWLFYYYVPPVVHRPPTTTTTTRPPPTTTTTTTPPTTTTTTAPTTTTTVGAGVATSTTGP